jgi:hypothetical protein
LKAVHVPKRTNAEEFIRVDDASGKQISIVRYFSWKHSRSTRSQDRAIAVHAIAEAYYMYKARRVKDVLSIMKAWFGLAHSYCKRSKSIRSRAVPDDELSVEEHPSFTSNKAFSMTQSESRLGSPALEALIML